MSVSPALPHVRWTSVCNKLSRRERDEEHHELAHWDGKSNRCAGGALILPRKCKAGPQAPPMLTPSTHGKIVCSRSSVQLQGWSCARRPGSCPGPLRRRASIQRRLMLLELLAVEIASPAAPVHRDRSSARPDGAGCCRFDRQTHVVTQRQRQPLARRCQPEPVLRAGDELWRWNDAGGSY